MSFDWFNKNIKPLLVGCYFEYSSFQSGDFGALERVEVEGTDKLATVDFWSEGWIGCDVFDCTVNNQIMNVLISPNEKSSIPEVFEKFLKLMGDSS